MNIVTKTAMSNFRRNKSRNILIGIAILLTTVLLTTVPTVLFGVFDLENAAVLEVYPTYDVMFRGVDEETAEQLFKDDRFAEAGLREDPAYVVTPESDISAVMVFADEIVCRQNRIELEEGEFPEKADEIVVSHGFLQMMSLNGKIGSQITVPYQVVQGNKLSLSKEKTFTITGVTSDSEEMQKEGAYSVMVSKAFADENIHNGKHSYRFYGCLKEMKGQSTDRIENEIEMIGEDYGINKESIVPNTEMLNALYKDSAAYAGLVIFMIVIVLAGILTIYSIYYVSMLGRVQEYGKLRAIGATKKQIRSLVLREGFAVAFAAVPLGIILGTGAGVLVIQGMLNKSLSANQLLADTMKNLLEEGEVSLVHLWIVGLAAAIAFATVYLALLYPMKIAGRITPVEAIRYQGEDAKRKRKKERKGYDELNTKKLTISNLERNRKRTVVTILTLGVTGIFFMAVATVLGCMNEKVMANEDVRSDIYVSINSWSGDMMHPERELQNIQKKNPLSDSLKEQIASLDGVEKIETGLSEECFILNNDQLKEDDGSALSIGVSGMNEEVLEKCKKYVTDGSLDHPKLFDGTGIVLFDGYVTRHSDLSVGDTVELKILDGDREITKKFEIVAEADVPQSLVGNSLALPSEVLQGFCETDVTDHYNIFVKESRLYDVTQAVRSLVQQEEFLEMLTYQEAYEDAEKSISLFVYGGYGVLLIFGLIGMLNLVNTMINSVHMRKKELGMLQAIGMSDRQTVRMLQMEGMFYTLGTLLLSLGIGSIAGYGLFRKMRADGMFSIKYYEYPVIPALVLVIVVVLLQLLITYLVNYHFKRQSLIERVRFAE